MIDEGDFVKALVSEHIKVNLNIGRINVSNNLKI